MIKQEIIEKISKYFKLTNFEAEKIYDDIFAGIIQGVKEDNIADITNLGEFIIKYNSSDIDNKKTVEFLPTLSLEDEINQRSFEEHRQFEPAKYVNPEETNKPLTENIVPPVIEAKTEIPEHIETNITEPVNYVVDQKMEQEIFDEKHNVEDEIKRRREEILSKITTPKVEQLHKTPEIEASNTIIPPVIIPPVEIPVNNTVEEVKQEVIEVKEVTEEKTEEIFNKSEEIFTKNEDTSEKITENITDNKKEVEEITEKSFSDYFSEISKEEQHITSQANTTAFPPVPPVVESNTLPPVETVIPPSAVKLHNELTGDVNKTTEYQTTINPMPYANGNGNGNGNNFEHRLQDNSYYIWYKDSEPNSTDTQTMSYEYELLYQATKEAEYKSKLRIYVTTFIMFFSIVLLLLIFSPVIYKYFFTPKEDQNTEEVQQETSTTEEPKNNTQNQASVNSLESQPPVTNNTQQNNTQETPKQEANQQLVQEQPKQEQPKQEQPKQEQPKQEEPKKEQPVQQNTNQNIPGVTKSTMGWMDDNNKVIYVQLENGKFTIQESAWDSDAKANKRISAVGALIPGLKGSVLKVDLGSKGTWFRARFGEFSTIEEAKQKAEELRTKEKNRLQALLLTFLLYT
jgi:nucleoid DNA-binding protein